MLLTPQFLVKGIIATHFGTHRTTESMEESCQECVKLLDLMGLTGIYPVYRSARAAMKSETDYEFSEGARAIVDEALSVTLGGPYSQSPML